MQGGGGKGTRATRVIVWMTGDGEFGMCLKINVVFTHDVHRAQEGEDRHFGEIREIKHRKFKIFNEPVKLFWLFNNFNS